MNSSFCGTEVAFVIKSWPIQMSISNHPLTPVCFPKNGNQTALAGWTSGTKLENERINRSMGFTIDIDAGVTFTDGLFTDGMVIKRVKVDTTPPMTSRCRG